MKNGKKNKNARVLFVINQSFRLISVFLFCSVIIISGILFFVLPKQEISELERRKLESFPKFTFKSVFSGKFADELSLYISDNFIFRDTLVSKSFELENKRGIRPDGVKLYGDNTIENSNTDIKENSSVDGSLDILRPSKLDKTTLMLGEDSVARRPSSSDIISDPSEYADITKADLTGEQRGALFTIGDTALEIFYGNSSVAKDYANTINSFRESLPLGVRIFDMTVPTHFEFGLPSKYKDSYGRRQKPFIDEIYSLLDAGVTPVDAYSSISKHYNKGEYLYFRTDHHWTALGAYYAYVAFAESASFEPVAIEKYESGKIDKFLGTFYSATYDSFLSGNPDFVEYYIPFTNYKMTNYRDDGVSTYEGTVIYKNISSVSGGYLCFMGGDMPLSIIETDNNFGNSIIVFKESYGNAFIPFLLAHYDKIYVADIRTFPFDSISYITENNITDVLFCNNIMTACTPARVLNIINLIL